MNSEVKKDSSNQKYFAAGKPGIVSIESDDYAVTDNVWTIDSGDRSHNMVNNSIFFKKLNNSNDTLFN